MRILIVTPQVPLPNVSKCGAAVKNFNLIQQLAKDHEIHLLTLMISEHDRIHLEKLSGMCTKVIGIVRQEISPLVRIKKTFLSTVPDLALRFISRELLCTFSNILNEMNYDIIQIEGLELSQLLFQIGHHKSKKILDEHNAEYMLAWRNMCHRLHHLNLPLGLHSLVQFLKLLIYEKKAIKIADLILTVSENDKTLLSRIAPSGNFVTIPTSVKIPTLQVDLKKIQEKNYLLFAGVMNYKPNVDGAVWFANKVFPTIKDRVPDARLFLVGKDPVPFIKKLSGNDQVVVTGEVPDIEPFFLQSKIAVIPLKIAGGTSTKCVEAMAYGLPVVVSPSVAKAMGRTIEKEVIVCRSKDEFAQKCELLLRSSNFWQEASIRCRKAIKEKYNIVKIAEDLSCAYDRMF